MEKVIELFTPPQTGHPADILDNAAAVTRFLCDLAPHLSRDNADDGLSAKGAHGLWLILNSLEESIETAAGRL